MGLRAALIVRPMLQKRDNAVLSAGKVVDVMAFPMKLKGLVRGIMKCNQTIPIT